MSTTIVLCEPLAVLLGANNAGKSNVIYALRVVHEPEAGPRGRCWLREDNLAHDGLGNRIANEEFEVRLHGLRR